MTTTSFTPGYTYTVQNRGSEWYANVASFSSDQSAPLEQLRLQDPSSSNREFQTWHVFLLDHGNVLLVNRGSGLCANVASYSASKSAHLEQFSLQEDEARRKFQQWNLKQDTAAPAGWCLMTNVGSALYVNVAGFSTGQSAHLEQFSLQGDSDSKRYFENWSFNQEDEYTKVTGLVPLSGVDIGDIPRMVSYAPTPNSKSTEVLVGQVAVPFPLVSDSMGGGVKWQVDNTPYYILKRYGYWDRQFYYEHTSASADTYTTKATFGLTSSDSETVSKTTGWSVNSDTSVTFKHFSSSFAATFSEQLTVTQSSTTTRTATVEQDVTRTFAAGTHASEAVWWRADRYVLERLNGDTLLEWHTRDASTSRSDTYSDD
ncbi:RICIN domain-containing protein [Streptomyces anulatus]|uniref:RICIN domain-containing protein n=1 Tax=Streptomyces anulatus TaxID=1892 RepID=UPI00341C2B1A